MNITETAVKKFTEILKEADNKGHLRSLLAEGCHGKQLAIDIVAGAEKEDLTVEKDGFKYFIDKDAVEYLKDAVMDCDKDGNIVIEGIPAPHGHHYGGDCCGGEAHGGEDKDSCGDGGCCH